MRRVGVDELERRLREAGGRGEGLSGGFWGEMARRLDEEGSCAEHGRHGRGTLGRWLVGGGLAAAGIAVAVIALRPGAPSARAPDAPAVARALGEAVEASVRARPRVMAMGMGEDAVQEEARKLLSDARQLAGRLSEPVREWAAP